MKTCQNIFESCHEPIGANPYDLCDGCLWWNALRAVRQIAQDAINDHYNHNHIMRHIFRWFECSPRRSEDGPIPQVLQDFEDAFTKESQKDNRLSSMLILERELIKQAPEGMRDNQPSISDILNLPF